MIEVLGFRVVLGFHWGYIGVILGLYWGYIGIMEKKMELLYDIWGHGPLLWSLWMKGHCIRPHNLTAFWV